MSSSNEKLFRLRHSLAHILAQAVLEIRPGSTLGSGPPIESGFYYDFILSSPLSEKDFPDIEARMKRIIGAEAPFIPPDCFRLRALGGAYWLGDSKNVMMTRIHAWAFESAEELKRKIVEHEEWLKRDHKKLGKELELFAFDEEIGPGLPLWLPNGTILRDELERFIRELEFQGGYQRVATPHLARKSLYLKTGHLPYFEEDMFPEIKLAGSESYYLRPMNCPHHHKIFALGKRSYRDLPFRLAEYGQVYRYEGSGALQGLLRVRGLCQNDAHIYVTKEQIAEELSRVLNLYQRAYAVLGLSDYRFRLSKCELGDSVRRNKYAGDPKAWEWAESCLREALEKKGLPFFEAEGEATFYGPKIDIQMRLGPEKEETASTIQLDFVSAERLGLSYIGEDGHEHRPYIIHRAPLGTHERFAAILIERFAGNFPSWLSPVQARVLAIAERHRDYGARIVEDLRHVYLRAELDRSKESLPKKIRLAAAEKVPYVIVVGDRELEGQSVSIRKRGEKDPCSLSVVQFREALLKEVRERELRLSVV